MRRAHTAVVILLAFSAIACSGGAPSENNDGAASGGTAGEGTGGSPSDDTATGGAPDGSPIMANTEMEACVAYVEARCARYAECRPNVVASCLGLRAQCPTRMFGEGSNWTIESVVACAGQWKSLSCEDLVQDKHPDCFQNGSFPDGEACFANSQCQSGYCGSWPANSQYCGTCYTPLPSGSPCSTAAGSRCSLGDFCDEVEDEMYQCLPSVARPTITPVQEGGECGRFGPDCATGLACQIELVGNDWEEPDFGTCVPDGQLDGPCVQTFGRVGSCGEGATCNARPTGDCVAYPTVGESCGFTHCDAHSVCDFSGTSNVCVARIAAGQPCTRGLFSEGQHQCDEGLECLCNDAGCQDALCGTPREAGQSCNDSTELCARHLQCVDGTCELPADPVDWWSALQSVCQ